MVVANNFKSYVKAFKEDTGFDVNKENMSLYLQYYLARTSDAQMQIAFDTLQFMKNPPPNIKR